MKLNPAPFELIKSSHKTIELRLYDEKRQLINVGDKIVFTNTVTNETLNTAVLNLHIFASFDELYKSLPLLKCGYTSENVHKASPTDMEQYYAVEEQKKYGVVGIELVLTVDVRKINLMNLDSVYDLLKDKYDLILTNTFSLENAAEYYDEDYMILRGKSSIGQFELSDCGLYLIFDVCKNNGEYLHWHPSNYNEAVNDIELFMHGYCREQ